MNQKEFEINYLKGILKVIEKDKNKGIQVIELKELIKKKELI